MLQVCNSRFCDCLECLITVRYIVKVFFKDLDYVICATLLSNNSRLHDILETDIALY